MFGRGGEGGGGGKCLVGWEGVSICIYLCCIYVVKLLSVGCDWGVGGDGRWEMGGRR